MSSPVENEDFFLVLGVGDLHVGDHQSVDVLGVGVQVDLHAQRGSRLDRQLVVDQDTWNNGHAILIPKLRPNERAIYLYRGTKTSVFSIKK